MSDIKFEQSDPRPEDLDKDDLLDDCVPRALALMTGISYEFAIAEMEQLARDISFPISDHPYTYKKIYEIYFARRQIYPTDCYITLGEFCSDEANKDRQCILYISSLQHIGFFDKGVMKDTVNNYKPEQLVTCIYESVDK